MNSGGELETWIRDKGLTERQAEQIKEHIQKIKEKVKKDK
jgi:endonuclease III